MRASPDVFSRIVCGIDQTAQSFEAVRQALRLRVSGGSVHLVTVAPTYAVVHPELIGGIVRAAGDALRHAVDEAGADTSRVVEGDVVQGMLLEIARERATLVALGIHGHSRAAGIYLGSTATALLHEAPCSVLVARHVAEFECFPQRIVLGIDGSPESLRAAAVARELFVRFGGELRTLAATRGKPIDADGSIGLTSELCLGVELVERAPTDALVEAASSADLLVVGSRGLHGFRALGSVSERVAHGATCSVLVVHSAPGS